MSKLEINVEFGKCSFDIVEDEEEEVLPKVHEESEASKSIRTGNLLCGEHRKDSKHIPFMLAPYSIDVELLISKIFDLWEIPFPRIALTAITDTEDSPSEMYREVSRKLVKGLIHALHAADMWLCTNGLDYGFSRDVGRAFDDEATRRKTIESNVKNVSFSFPDTALIGICVKDSLKFSNKFDSNEREEGKEDIVEGKNYINRRYGYFIILEDTSEKRKGLSDFLVNFTDYISKHGAKMSNEDYEKAVEIPVICLLMHGKISQIDLVFRFLKNGLPVVIFEGSGGIADLIAYAYQQASYRPEGVNVAEYTEAVLKPQVSDRMHELYPDHSDYEISLLTEKVFDCIRYSKQRDQELITVLNIWKVEFKPSSLPSYLLKALFKSKSSDFLKDKAQMKKDLFFAMDWNCADVAREQVFARDTSRAFQIDAETFSRALTKPQREDFVSLFLYQGFVVHTYLDSSSLLELFQNSMNREFFRSVVWESVLGFGTNVEITRSFLDSKLIILIEELTGIPSLINSYELDWNRRAVYDDRTPHEAERKAMAVLTIWAILSYRVQLVKVLWKHSEQPIHIALACSIILKKLEAFVTDLSLKNEMEKQSKEFSEMAVNVMSMCYDNVPCRALDLLNEKNRVWSCKALMELAAFSKNKMFIAHPCCQKYLDNIFMGYIRIRDLPYGDITIPFWLKVILCAFLIFPMYFWVRFEVRSKDKSLKESPSKEQENSSKEVSKKEQSPISEEKELSEPNFFYKIYYFWSAPVTKFWVCQVFYVLFLFTFSFAVVWPACGNVILDFFTCIWIAIFILDSIYHAYTLNIKYTSMPLVYKCIEISIMILFLFFYVTSRIIWRDYIMSPYAAKVMLCIALLYFYYRLIFISLPISSELGPMLYRVKRMLVVDFVSFIRVTVLVIISNGVVIHAVIYPDYPLNLELARKAFYDAMISFFLSPVDFYGSADPKCIRLKRGSVQAPFTGYINECKVGRYLKYNCPNPGVWPYLFGLQYLIIIRLILLVLLFAIFSNTTKILEDEGKYIWKYQRYALVINFSNRLTLPPPLSIITLIYMLCRYLFYCLCDFLNQYILKYSKIKGFRRSYDSSPQDKLDEDDYRHWKNLAMQYHNEKKQETEGEVTTKKRMDHVNALSDSLNKQRIQLRVLDGHLNELQLQITNAHQYLEGAGLQVSMRERLHAKNVPQIFSRISPYPNTMISRFPVSDNHVPWKCTWTSYDPISFTLSNENFSSIMRPHVDVDIQRKREIEGEAFRMPLFNWNKLTITPGGECIDRQSWIIDKQNTTFVYELDSEELPRNPFGRTGLKGRGCLPRWGPNHYVYVIITRWHKDEDNLYNQYLDVVLMVKDDGFSLPGGYVHTESRYETVQSFFQVEKKWTEKEDMISYFEELTGKDMSERRSSIWQRLARGSSSENVGKDLLAERVKLGYMDSDTNTDQAWCEAEVWHIHYNIQSKVDEKFKANMEWYFLNEENLLKIPVGQAAIIFLAAKNVKAALEIT